MRSLKRISFLLLFAGCLFAGSSGFAQSSTSTGSTYSSTNPSGSVSSAPIPQNVVLTLIKQASKKLGVSADILYAEFQTGGCCIHLLDEKTQTYLVVSLAGGNTTLILEGTL